MERKKSIHVWLYTILIVGIIAAVIWGATATKNAKALEVTTENQYNRAFHELVGYVDDIDTAYKKSRTACKTFKRYFSTKCRGKVMSWSASHIRSTA